MLKDRWARVFRFRTAVYM